MGNRGIGIGGLDHPEHTVVLNQPGPAAAELGNGRRLKFLFELFHRSEIAFDFGLQLRARFAAAVFAHGFPEKGMVPGLCRIVENARGLRLADGRTDDVVKIHGRIQGVFDQVI